MLTLLGKGPPRRWRASPRRRCSRRTGTVRTADGYDPESQLWCAKVPLLQIPERPSREQVVAALRLLRTAFRPFPFAAAPRRKDEDLGPEEVDLHQPPSED